MLFRVSVRALLPPSINNWEPRSFGPHSPHTRDLLHNTSCYLNSVNPAHMLHPMLPSSSEISHFSAWTRSLEEQSDKPQHEVVTAVMKPEGVKESREVQTSRRKHARISPLNLTKGRNVICLLLWRVIDRRKIPQRLRGGGSDPRDYLELLTHSSSKPVLSKPSPRP